MTREAIEHAASTVANKATVSGIVTSFVGAAADSSPTFWVGTAIGVIGLVVNWYYKHQEHKRNRAEHLRKMSQTTW